MIDYDEYFSYTTVIEERQKFYNAFVNFIYKMGENVKDPYVNIRMNRFKRYIGCCMFNKYHVVKAPKIKECIYAN